MTLITCMAMICAFYDKDDYNEDGNIVWKNLLTVTLIYASYLMIYDNDLDVLQ